MLRFQLTISWLIVLPFQKDFNIDDIFFPLVNRKQKINAWAFITSSHTIKEKSMSASLDPEFFLYRIGKTIEGENESLIMASVVDTGKSRGLVAGEKWTYLYSKQKKKNKKEKKSQCRLGCIEWEERGREFNELLERLEEDLGPNLLERKLSRYKNLKIWYQIILFPHLQETSKFLNCISNEMSE